MMSGIQGKTMIGGHQAPQPMQFGKRYKVLEDSTNGATLAGTVSALGTIYAVNGVNGALAKDPMGPVSMMVGLSHFFMGNLLFLMRNSQQLKEQLKDPEPDEPTVPQAEEAVEAPDPPPLSADAEIFVPVEPKPVVPQSVIKPAGKEEKPPKT